MAPVCQTCGDIGFEEALVYCDSCKIEAIHRYCVGITPTPFTEYITWICEDCDGSDSEFDNIEVDQTAKLTHILKKSDEKIKKEKKSSNHTQLVLAEDHGFHDVTNFEPVEVPSSPTKETTKESKKRKSSDSGKPHELTSLVRNGASASEAEKSSSVPDHSYCTRKRNDSGSDRKEVDHTANLEHILEKSEKKKKKKKTDKGKKNKKSSNHSPPFLAVENNELHDATNVEPVEVSSSPIKETVESNSGTDHNPGTSKRSDNRSNQKEVDQTDKLLNISKKNEKKKKKKKKKTNKEKKNNTMSSNPTLRVLAVEDHDIQDATNVEPVKVSSSPIKETTKESKKRKSSDIGKPHELTGLVRDGASAPETEKSSSVPDHNSCTNKRNDSGSDHKEVDQAANLGHILEKSEKKKKKKKKKKKDKEKKNEKSSHHSPPVLAVENNEPHDATNVEPLEVSSSPTEETMESKRQESSGSRKPHELTNLDGNGASVSEAENSSSVPDHNSCTTNKRKLSSGSIWLTENRQLADGNSSCKETGSNMPQTSERLTSRHYIAQPIKIPIWRGLMSIKGGKSCSIDGIVAHVSSLACPKVHETASSLRGRLSAEMLPRLEIWPKTFLKYGGPKDESIALFFFASSESNDEKLFYYLVGEMKENDLAMRCMLDDAELLLFTSYMLPMGSRSFNSKHYLWGVFKPRQTSQH